MKSSKQDYSVGSYKHVATFCHVSTNTCPKAYINENAPEEKAVKVVDDFDNVIFMSREQYQAMTSHSSTEKR